MSGRRVPKIEHLGLHPRLRGGRTSVDRENLVQIRQQFFQLPLRNTDKPINVRTRLHIPLCSRGKLCSRKLSGAAEKAAWRNVDPMRSKQPSSDVVEGLLPLSWFVLNAAVLCSFLGVEKVNRHFTTSLLSRTRKAMVTLRLPFHSTPVRLLIKGH